MLPLGLLNLNHFQNVKSHLLARFASTQPLITTVPHSFNPHEALNKFYNADSNKLFRPIQWDDSNLPKIITGPHPLKKVLLPFFGAHCKISSTEYEGEVGVEKSRWVLKWNHKKEGLPFKLKKEYYTEWYNVTGTLNATKYSEDHNGMKIYGSFTWSKGVLEEAFGGLSFIHKNFKTFEQQNIDSDTHVDPFVKKAPTVWKEVFPLIQSCESARAEHQMMQSHSYATEFRVKRVNINYQSTSLSSYMLPGYILQYENGTPRVMHALSQDPKIAGNSEISAFKVMSAVAALTSILSLFAPHITIPSRILGVFLSSLGAGSWAKYRSPISTYFQNRVLERDRLENETVAETPNDRLRRESTTQKIECEVPNQVLDIPAKHLKRLMLDPNKPITKEIVNNHYRRIMKVVHPDRNPQLGNVAMKLNISRTFILNKLEERQNQAGARSYCTTAVKVKVELPKSSVYHPRAEQLIKAVLEGNEKKALDLVYKEEVPPDSHNRNENTLLTEAAKTGNLKAVKFAVERLNVTLDTSCDCPLHKTALHYAASNGHQEVVEYLIKKGANPNLINSRGETVLDVAKTSQIRALLAGNGAISNKNQSFFRQIFGYGSSERSLLLTGKEQNDLMLKGSGKEGKQKAIALEGVTDKKN